MPNWQLQTGVDCCSMLHAGSNFTSEQLQVLSTLAVVAVLIVNVTYFGWAQPPGGATPSWQGCLYHYLLLFQLLNGIAFVLSMTAVVAVTLLPLTLPMHPRYAVWCGSILVALSSGMLIAAFMFAGLVANGYAAPSPMCAAVRCNEGGVPCSLGQLPHTFGNTAVFAMDDNLAKLNGLTSPALCFGLDIGRGISQNLSTFMFTLIADLNLSDASAKVLCASVASTTVARGFSSSLNVFLKDFPMSFLAENSTFRPTASLSDLLGALDPQTIVPYKKLRYVCYSDIKHSSISSLCDTWAQVPNSLERLSVNPSGAYLTVATMLTNGGSLFVSEDITINSANNLSEGNSFLDFISRDVVPFHGLDPKVLGILAGVFACCMLGLAILVGAAHWSKVLTDVHCQMQLHILHPISTIFRNLAAGLYNKVPKRGKHSVS